MTSPPPSGAVRTGRILRKRRSFVIVLLTAVVAVALLLTAYTVTGGFRSSTVPRTALIPKDDYYSITGGQFNDVAFSVQSTSVVNGTFTNTLGIIVYLLTPAQLNYLATKGNVSSYDWSSGQIPNLEVYDLNVEVESGQWDLAFVNPSLVNTTVVGFWTDITVGAS